MTAVNNALAAFASKKASESQQEVAEVDTSNVKIFHGEFPISISLMTATGIPVSFYQGYHATVDPEVIEFLKKEKNVKDVTGNCLKFLFLLFVDVIAIGRQLLNLAVIQLYFLLLNCWLALLLVLTHCLQLLLLIVNTLSYGYYKRNR